MYIGYIYCRFYVIVIEPSSISISNDIQHKFISALPENEHYMIRFIRFQNLIKEKNLVLLSIESNVYTKAIIEKGINKRI